MRIIFDKLRQLESFYTNDLDHFPYEGKRLVDQTQIKETLKLSSADEQLLVQLFSLKLMQQKIDELVSSIKGYDEQWFVSSIEDPWTVRLNRNQTEKLRSAESKLKAMISVYTQESGEESSINRIRAFTNAVNILFARLRGRKNLRPGDQILIKWMIELKTRLSELEKSKPN